MSQRDFRYKAFISYSHAADGRLAPAIQRALQQLAKPWYKMRALEVFRDETNLSVSPDLWASVEVELARSEYFILLASRGAAESHWVRREVEFWLANRSPKKLLIVATDGDIVWDTNASDFNWDATTALPKELAGQFHGEPLFLDLRSARTLEDLSLDNPIFKNKVVVLAAALHGLKVGDMIGEEVRQFTRTRRVRNSAIATLVALLALAGVLAMIANNQSRQRLRQFKLAQAGNLANQARRILPENPTIALRLSLEAFRLNPQNPPNVVQNALCQAFYEPVIARQALYSRTIWLNDYVRFASPSPDGRGFFTSSNDFVVNLFDWDGRKLLQLPHEDVVHTIVPSPDGGRVLTVTLGNLVRVWDAARGTLRLRLSLPNVTGASFSPDGSQILLARDRVVELREASGTLVRSYSHEDASVESAFFAGSEARILTSAFETPESQYRQAYTLRDISGRALATFTDRRGFVASRVVAPDGRLIMTVVNQPEHVATLWDLSGKERAVLKDFSLVEDAGIQFSPAGDRVIALTKDHKAKVWDTSGRLLYELAGHADVIERSHFLPDGRLLTASADNTAVLWDTAGQLLWTLKGHDANVTSAVFSPRHRRIATTSRDRTVRLWNLDDQHSLLMLPGLNGYALAGAVSPSNRFYLTADEARVDLWDAAGRRLRTIPDHSGYAQIAFSPDDERFATAPFGNEARIWRVNGEQVAALRGHTGEIVSIRFARESGQIVTASTDSTARIWSADGRPLRRLASHRGGVTHAEFSPDGRRVLTTSQDSSAILWSVDGSKVARLVGHRGGISASVFSPEGAIILTASYDSTVGLWNDEGQLITRLVGHRGPVRKVAFVDDGRRILTVSSDYTARLWDRSGTFIAQVQGQDMQLSDAYTSHGGNVIVALSYMGDGSVLRLSDVNDNEICTLRAHTSEVYAVVFSPDDQRVMSLGYDGKGIVWFLPPTLYDRLSKRSLYELSTEERQRYGVALGR